jgi:DnaK suppressor protein
MGKESSHPHLDAAERVALERRLEAERQRLLSLYDESFEREKEIPQGEAEDRVDRAEEGWHREEIFAGRENERDQLLAVEEALARLAGGRYGFCFKCGKPIPLERLRAVPATRHCAAHQAQVERGLLEPAGPGDRSGAAGR